MEKYKHSTKVFNKGACFFFVCLTTAAIVNSRCIDKDLMIILNLDE